MLTVQDIVSLPALGLRVAAGAAGLAERRPLAPRLRARRPDAVARRRRAPPVDRARDRLRRDRAEAPTSPGSPSHRLAGLGFGLGFGHETVPSAARRGGRPPELPDLRRAVRGAVHRHLEGRLQPPGERAARARHTGPRGTRAARAGSDARSRRRGLLAVVASHLGCSLALVDESGRVLVERHARRRVGFENALELPVVADDEMAVLRAARAARRVRRVRPPRPAPRPDGARLRALQAPRGLRGGAASRRRPPRRPRARAPRRSRGSPPDGRVRARARTAARAPGRRFLATVVPGGQVRAAVARELDRRAIRYLSTVRRDRAAFLVEIADEEAALALARRARSSSSRGRASASAGRRRGGRWAVACSRRAPRSARPARASSRTGISARWSCC